MPFAGPITEGDWDERVAMHQWWSDYLDALRASDETQISALTAK
ncbi:hypothetical protein SAMN06295937_10224 [Sphingopyxis flava]|uniref:Uncharacterized protein n=1 Tax=Sphingopyxis flava TaxID=1507287 RepID=A0A1T5EGY5_9SPHN|nr:hypothetical protein SAMN06295937_10224 [Sphingopyxis flava]